MAAKKKTVRKTAKKARVARKQTPAKAKGR